MRAELVITAASSLTPYGLGTDAYAKGAAAGAVEFTPMDGSFSGAASIARVPGYDARQLLDVRSVSNLDRLTLHVCVAVDQLHKALGFTDQAQRGSLLADHRISLVLGTSGPIQSIMDFDLQTIQEPRFVQPSSFPGVVFNVPASYAAIRHGIRGGCITLTDGDSSSLHAFAIAAAQLESNRIDLAIVGGAEEATPAYALYRTALASNAGQPCPPISEGAAMFALERAEQAKAAGRSSLAGLFGCTQVFSPDDCGAGLRACLGKLRRRFGAMLDEVGVVCCEDDLDLAALGLDQCNRVSLARLLGHTGALYGAMATLHALALDDIKPGEVILILQGGRDGTCAAALLQKHSGLPR